MLDGGVTAQLRASTVQQRSEEVYVALQYAALVHCLVDEWKDCEESKPRPKVKWTFVNKNVEAKKHRTEWRAAASKYRCVRCNKMKMAGTCEGPRWLGKASKHEADDMGPSACGRA